MTAAVFCVHCGAQRYSVHTDGRCHPIAYGCPTCRPVHDLVDVTQYVDTTTTTDDEG